MWLETVVEMIKQRCAIRKSRQRRGNINTKRNSMRLIDADKALEQINEWLDQTGAILLNTSYHFELLGCIEDCPTIDAVPVVRCGECANAKCIDKNESVYTCTHPQWTRRPHKDTFEESQLFHGLDGNDFCSYGTKMEDKP